MVFSKKTHTVSNQQPFSPDSMKQSTLEQLLLETFLPLPWGRLVSSPLKNASENGTNSLRLECDWHLGRSAPIIIKGLLAFPRK